MVTKEQAKQEIDQLSDDVVEQIYLFMSVIQPKKPVKKRIRVFKGCVR